jgi:hypothetical protein
MSRSKKRYCRNIAAALVLILGLTMPITTPQAQSGGNPGVIPPNARPYGLTYGDWSARWWQWALSIPATTNPLLDATGANCAEGQTGHVWFLAGTFGGSATRTCTIPPGKAIFFPIINIVFGSGVFDCDPTNPGVPCDVAALRASAASVMNNPILLEAEVDGRPLRNLNAYRAFSPVFSITHPSDSVFGVAPGTYTPQISDGYWIMLAPLSAGTHTVHFKGIADFFGTPFGTEVTYHLTVGH